MKTIWEEYVGEEREDSKGLAAEIGILFGLSMKKASMRYQRTEEIKKKR